jgi:hypothetical protein
VRYESEKWCSSFIKLLVVCTACDKNDSCHSVLFDHKSSEYAVVANVRTVIFDILRLGRETPR